MVRFAPEADVAERRDIESTFVKHPAEAEIEISVPAGPEFFVLTKPGVGYLACHQRHPQHAGHRFVVFVQRKNLIPTQIDHLPHAVRTFQSVDERTTGISGVNRMHARLARTGNNNRPTLAHTVEEERFTTRQVEQMVSRSVGMGQAQTGETEPVFALLFQHELFARHFTVAVSAIRLERRRFGGRRIADDPIDDRTSTKNVVSQRGQGAHDLFDVFHDERDHVDHGVGFALA